MKKIFFSLAALLMAAAVLTVSCEEVDAPENTTGGGGQDSTIVAPTDTTTVTPPDTIIAKDYPELPAVEGKIVIAAYFGTAPCHEVVLAGSYAVEPGEWAAWIQDPDRLQKFVPVGTLGGKEWAGWYKVEVDTAGASIEYDGVTYALGAKPVQLKADGSFDWSCQVGYNSDGDITAKTEGVHIFQWFYGECDLYFSGASVAVVFDRWKKDPCVPEPKHNHTFTVTVPAGTPENARVTIVGNFENAQWQVDNAAMQLTKGADGKYRITLQNVLEGAHYRYVLNNTWDNEELQATASGADCAMGLGSDRVTGAEEAINDVVGNWKGVTATQCP